MSHVHVCRLCTNICDDALSLCDTNGSFTEVYEIAIKFFNPKFLNVEHSTRNHLDVMCYECWHHISGFYNFQQTVHMVQAKLLKDAEEAKCMNIQSPAEILTTNGFPVKDEQEFVSLADVEVTNIPSKNQLIVTDCTLQFEADIDSLLERRLNTKIEIPSDVISVDENILSEGDDDFERPVGVFDGGEYDNERFNSADENSATVSSEANADHEEQIKYALNIRKQSQEESDIFIAQWRPILKCELCSEPFSTFTLLQKHFREMHPPTQCYIVCCKRKFKYPCRIRDHIRNHMDPDFFQCKFCKRRCATKYSLDSHIFYVHHNEKEEDSKILPSVPAKNPLRCEVCDKQFQFPSSLRTHLNVHNAQKSRKCSYCPSTFKYRSSYSNHLKEFHADKIDSTAFVADAGICKHCPKTFTYRTSLYHHTKACHPEEFAKRRRNRRTQSRVEV